MFTHAKQTLKHAFGVFSGYHSHVGGVRKGQTQILMWIRYHPSPLHCIEIEGSKLIWILASARLHYNNGKFDNITSLKKAWVTRSTLRDSVHWSPLIVSPTLSWNEPLAIAAQPRLVAEVSTNRCLSIRDFKVLWNAFGDGFNFHTMKSKLVEDVQVVHTSKGFVRTLQMRFLRSNLVGTVGIGMSAIICLHQ